MKRSERPGALVARLEEQDLSPLLIPHGTTWGLYTPAGTKLDKQLLPENRPRSFRSSGGLFRPWQFRRIPQL